MGQRIIITPPPNPNFNGYDYVDLGLPSGTLWATCNVGASKPTDYGQYFQWGDTSGYTADQVGTGEGQKKFESDWSDYKWYLSGSSDDVNSLKFTKYIAKSVPLELEDDAAHVNMGGDWHMPTPTQINELLNTAYTTNEWTTQDGVNGRLFTSTKDTSKSIFIPAAGNAQDGSLYNIGTQSNVWSSMTSGFSSRVYIAQRLWIFSLNARLIGASRFFGSSVRGVIG